MASNIPRDEQSFWALFDKSALEDQFRYELNKQLTWILFLFGVALLVGAGFISSQYDLGSAPKIALWAFAGIFFVGIIGVLFIWRMYCRRSGVLITEEALIWLDRTIVHYCPWSWLNAERFGVALEGARTTQGSLSLDWDETGRILTLYTPYMRVDHPALTLAILLRIKPEKKS